MFCVWHWGEHCEDRKNLYRTRAKSAVPWHGSPFHASMWKLHMPSIMVSLTLYPCDSLKVKVYPIPRSWGQLPYWPINYGGNRGTTRLHQWKTTAARRGLKNAEGPFSLAGPPVRCWLPWNPCRAVNHFWRIIVILIIGAGTVSLKSSSPSKT